ncbi:MAG TPA: glycosyltransferase family 87 protein [Terracidiphilus sp.]|nr:glycosyltransferase family 87 protein [Terracidiphilus sp.]
MPISHLSVNRNSHVSAALQAIVASACGLACLASVVCFLLVHVDRGMAGNRDFVVYWATGRQLVQHGNPYDAEVLRGIEHTAGLPSRYSVGYMRNPPWSLPLVWPLGLLSLRAASIAASLGLIAAFIASVRMLLGLYECRNRVVRLLAWSFAPALICLIWGQTSLLVLLGFVVFLRFYRTRPILAGAGLWLCALKPHLLLPLGVILVAWIVLSKSYRILFGTGAALLVSAAATLAIDPHAWNEYVRMAGYSGFETDPIPSLGMLLRTHVAPGVIALQFVPAALGCAWAIVYFWPRRHNWDWAREGCLLLLVSVLAAPYAYLNDHVLVLPALVFAASFASSRSYFLALAVASAVLEVAFFANRLTPAPFYWATVAAGLFWIAWYVAATRLGSHAADAVAKIAPVHSV